MTPGPHVRLAGVLDAVVSRLTLAAARVALPVLIAATVLNVVGRQFGAARWDTLYELVGEVFFALVMLSFGYAYLRDGHVRVDVARERIAPRGLAVIELVGCLAILLPVSAFLVAYGGEAAWRALVQGERSAAFGDLRIQWAVKAMVPLGFLLLLLAALAVIARNLSFLFGHGEAPAPTGGDELPLG